MKTIITLLFATILMFTQPASAYDLTQEQSDMLQKYLAEPESRAAITAIHWDNVRREVNNANTQLPMEVHPNVIMMGMEYDGLREIKYYFITDNPEINFDLVNAKLSVAFCQDPQMAMYMTIFDGTFQYNYFLEGRYETVFKTWRITKADCGSGI
jgi:hypothetical protein